MTMRDEKKKRLERAGWQFGSADEFIGLLPDESAYLDLKAKLGTTLRQWRKARPMTQVQLAKRLGSSQSRVAKMEAGDPSASLDLIVRSLIGLGASNSDLAEAIAAPGESTGPYL